MGYKHEIEINDIDWCKTSINPNICAAVTAQSTCMIYDLRSNKSKLSQKIGEYSLNKIKISSKRKCLISDANANIWEYDYLKSCAKRGKMYRRYRGFVGSIRDFDLHPTKNLLGSVGLGRYAVIHRINQPNLPLMKVYLKQKLNTVLFSRLWEDIYETDEMKEERLRKEQELAHINEFLKYDDMDYSQTNMDDVNAQMSRKRKRDDPIWDELNQNEFNGDNRSSIADVDMDGNNGIGMGNDDDNDSDINELLDGYESNELRELLQDIEHEIEKEKGKPNEEPVKKKMRME